MHVLIGWGWIGAALFGVLIAATDPVAVIAAFREMNVERRLSMLVEAASLLNDGAAAVGFALLVAIAAGGAVTPKNAFNELRFSRVGRRARLKGEVVTVATADAPLASPRCCLRPTPHPNLLPSGSPKGEGPEIGETQPQDVAVEGTPGRTRAAMSLARRHARHFGLLAVNRQRAPALSRAAGRSRFR